MVVKRRMGSPFRCFQKAEGRHSIEEESCGAGGGGEVGLEEGRGRSGEGGDVLCQKVRHYFLPLSFIPLCSFKSIL